MLIVGGDPSPDTDEGKRELSSCMKEKIFCVSLVFYFSWDDCDTQEKSKTKIIKVLGGKQGVLWEMCKWQIVVNSLLNKHPCPFCKILPLQEVSMLRVWRNLEFVVFSRTKKKQAILIHWRYNEGPRDL